MGELERRHRDDLVVLGVQSPRYPAEAVPENVHEAVRRLDIEHPVVVDAEHRVWDAYAVNAWPTLVFISPTGEVIGRHAGEATFEALNQALEPVIAQYRQEGVFTPEVPELKVQPFSRPGSELSFPGKVLATAEYVFIADTSHHRLIVVDHFGQVQEVIGTGVAGFQDGDFSAARFQRPQGMAHDGDRQVLYVADEENHAVREVELEQREVTTVAGTGEQSFRPQ